jgi:hypothetical protein
MSLIIHAKLGSTLQHTKNLMGLAQLGGIQAKSVAQGHQTLRHAPIDLLAQGREEFKIH